MNPERSLEAPPAISVIVPAFNEQSGIRHALERLSTAARALPGRMEVLVIDDGSIDRTAELAATGGADRVVTNPRNLGYGASLKKGIRAAKADVLVITDADGTYPAEAIPTLLRLLDEQTAMVVGWRKGFSAQIPLIRRPAKFVLRKFAESLAGYSIPDLNSGLRVFRKSSIEGDLGLLPDGFSFTTTMTLFLASRGEKIHYEPISYDKRKGRSKFRPIQDTWNMVTLIVRSVLLFSPLRVFVPLALFLLAASPIVAFAVFTLTGRIPDATVAIMVISAIQLVMLGLLADLINRRGS